MPGGRGSGCGRIPPGGPGRLCPARAAVARAPGRPYAASRLLRAVSYSAYTAM